MVSPISSVFVGKQKLSVSKGKGSTAQFCYGSASWLSSKMGNSWLQFHFLGGKYAFSGLVYMAHVSECTSFVGDVQNYSYAS